MIEMEEETFDQKVERIRKCSGIVEAINDLTRLAGQLSQGQLVKRVYTNPCFDGAHSIPDMSQDRLTRILERNIEAEIAYLKKKMEGI